MIYDQDEDFERWASELFEQPRKLRWFLPGYLLLASVLLVWGLWVIYR